MFHRTERLLLRPAWIEDAEGNYAGIGEHAVIRNLARAPWPYTIDNAREFPRARTWRQSAALPRDPAGVRDGDRPFLVSTGLKLPG